MENDNLKTESNNANVLLCAVREVQVYSNATDERLDYRKRYWFHKWLNSTRAVIEDEEGNIMKVQQHGNFKFKSVLG